MWMNVLLWVSFIGLAHSQCWRDTVCDGPEDTAFPGEWESNNFSPSSRSVSFKTALSWPELSPYTSAALELSSNSSIIVFDFGGEVGGILSFSYEAQGSGGIGIAFSESKNFVGTWSDSSTYPTPLTNGHYGIDGAIYTNFTSGNGTYIMPDRYLRGGFRYLTLFLETDQANAVVKPNDIAIEIGFQPTWSNLRAYQGYFHSNDDLLNRIWYAGAYTVQTNAVPVNTGRQIPSLKSGWANNATLGPGDTIIVDGAKRDRAVWPGDMGIAVPAAFVSTGDMESVKNALQVMYNTQTSTGAFLESGPPLSQAGSDTYHMWTMVGTYNYFLYTNDSQFVSDNWDGYNRAMDYIVGEIDSSGLLNVTGIRDWARWQQGFHNTEANMILYHTLLTGAKLAAWRQESDLSSSWSSKADSLAESINSACFDFDYGAFKDNDTDTSLIPQDANSFSLLFGVHSENISVPTIAERLTENWTPIGPVTPELPHNISPFISGFELLGRLNIRDTSRALELLRTTWGWIMNNENSTQSTLIEGYLANGSFSYRSDRGYNYDVSYPSHAHGWSSGPTSALTNYILGLDITEPAGSEWVLAPQFGDLTTVEGGFTTSLGKYSAKWVVNEDDGSVDISWSTPDSTQGVLELPFPKNSTKMTVNYSTGQGDESKTLATNSSDTYETHFGEWVARLGVDGGAGHLTLPV